VGANPVGQFGFEIGSKSTNICKNRNEKTALALGEDHDPAPKNDEAPVPAVLPILLRGMACPPRCWTSWKTSRCLTAAKASR